MKKQIYFTRHLLALTVYPLLLCFLTHFLLTRPPSYLMAPSLTCAPPTPYLSKVLCGSLDKCLALSACIWIRSDSLVCNPGAFHKSEMFLLCSDVDEMVTFTPPRPPHQHLLLVNCLSPCVFTDFYM